MSRRASTLVLTLAACAARPEPNLQLPRDPPVFFPDADFDPRPEVDGAVAADAAPGVDGGVAGEAGVGDAGVVEDGGVPMYWRDVYPIVLARCAFCHSADDTQRLAGVPPIVSFAHTQADSRFPGQSVADRMAARVLNAMGGAGDMPQRGSPFANDMTIEERRVIGRWVNGGAPEGDRPDGGAAFPDAAAPQDAAPTLPWASGPPSSDAGTPGVRYVDVYANTGDQRTPHRIPGRSTAYSCFVFTVPPNGGATDEYAIEFSPLLDQRRHVHHIEIYRQDPNNPRDPVGNNGPTEWHLNTWWDCEGRTSQEQLIANYVPGQPLPIRLPRGTGYLIRPGDRLMMEIHYDSVPPGGLLDMTGFRITTTTTQAGVQNVGEFWVGPLWGYDIAPTTNNTMGRRVQIEAECVVTAPVTVFWIRPHMHGRGARQSFWIRRGGGARSMLAEVDPWDAGNQPLFDVPRAEQQFLPGDVVGTSCEFFTEARDLRWGTGGIDEMCFFNMIHYPYTFTQSSCFVRCDGDRSRCPVTYP